MDSNWGDSSRPAADSGSDPEDDDVSSSDVGGDDGNDDDAGNDGTDENVEGVPIIPASQPEAEPQAAFEELGWDFRGECESQVVEDSQAVEVAEYPTPSFTDLDLDSPGPSPSPPITAEAADPIAAGSQAHGSDESQKALPQPNLGEGKSKEALRARIENLR